MTDPAAADIVLGPGDVNFMPAIADVKVISEALDDTWERLASILRRSEDDTGA